MRGKVRVKNKVRFRSWLWKNHDEVYNNMLGINYLCKDRNMCCVRCLFSFGLFYMLYLMKNEEGWNQPCGIYTR